MPPHGQTVEVPHVARNRHQSTNLSTGQQLYEIRFNFQTYGADGLINRLPGTRGSHPNGVVTEIETAILDHALEHPCHGHIAGRRKNCNGPGRIDTDEFFQLMLDRLSTLP